MPRKEARATGGDAVRYRIEPIDPAGHHFEVVCDIAAPDPAGQRVSLPAWIPGSYMIREFARNIVAIAATSNGKPVQLTKLDKHSWRAAPTRGPLRLVYRVYAWDPSVRAAHLDDSHGFFNGTSVFLCAEGHETSGHAVEIVAPRGRGFKHWQVATTLPEAGAPRHGFGRYRADDYDALIDHPVEMGRFRLEAFEAAGVTHEIAYTGDIPRFDADRVNADLARLCAAQIAFFSSGEATAPFERYLFLVAVASEGYGGLEHRSSTALVASRDSLPSIEGGPPGDAYRSFLGLVSHEYFHSWNVKRIKPARFAPYDLEHENYTSLLWIFEGFTSYYDDLFLVRTGLIDRSQYLAELARTIDEVMAGSGRTLQSVAESSFDAWVKYYRPDENTPNAVVSYYRKGSLVALCLDLHIRTQSRGRRSLDDVMRLLWQRYGKDFYPDGRRGIGEDEFPALVEEATGVDVVEQVRAWAYGTDELPIAALFEPFGLRLQAKPQRSGAALGARTSATGNDCRITHVEAGGPAHRAGLAAGDHLVAIDGLRVVPSRLDPLLARYRPGETVEVTSFRADRLQTRPLVLASAPKKSVIVEAVKPGKAALRQLGAWLGS